MPKVRMTLLWIAVVFLSCNLAATWAFAKGKGMGSGGHSGWSKKKKNSEMDIHPGLEKKSEDWNPSLIKEKVPSSVKEKVGQEGNGEPERLQNKEHKRLRERKHNRERNQEGKPLDQ